MLRSHSELRNGSGPGTYWMLGDSKHSCKSHGLDIWGASDCHLMVCDSEVSLAACLPADNSHFGVGRPGFRSLGFPNATTY